MLQVSLFTEKYYRMLDAGGLGERFNPPVLKTGVRKRTVSSNLTPSAINQHKLLFYIVIKLIIFFGVQRGVQLKRGYPVYASLPTKYLSGF